MSLAPVTHVTGEGRRLNLDCSRSLSRVVEVHDVLRGDRLTVAHSRVEVPALQHFQYFLLYPVTHSLQYLGFDDIALRIDGDLDDHVALNSRRQVATRDGRIWVDIRKGGNDLISGERRARYVAKQRTTTSSL
jgi:hypothetical protein